MKKIIFRKKKILKWHRPCKESDYLHGLCHLKKILLKKNKFSLKKIKFIKNKIFIKKK